MRSTLAHRIHRSAIHWLGHDPATGALLSAGADGQVLVWHPQKPDEVRVLAILPDTIYSAHLATNSRLLVVGTSKGELFVLDLVQRSEVQRIVAHAGAIFSLLYLDGQLLCAGGDGALTTWTWQADHHLAAVRRVPLSTAKLRATASKDEHLAIASGDGDIHVLDRATLNQRAQWAAHENGASALAWHPSKPVLLSGGKDGTLAVWDARGEFQQVLRHAAHRSTIYALAFSPDGLLLATASRDKTVKLWDANTLDPLERLDLQQKAIRTA